MFSRMDQIWGSLLPVSDLCLSGVSLQDSIITMAMLTLPYLLCAALVLSGAVVPNLSSVKVQQDPSLGQMDEDANPPSLLSNEEEMVSDSLEEHGAEKDMVAAKTWCPLGWSSYGTRCFLYVASGREWLDAERYCVQLGGNLASVHSLGEHIFIRSLIRHRTGGDPWTWIGGTDAVRNRNWLWSDGSRFNFQYWAHGEPNNHQQREPCINTNFGDQLAWNDLYCQATLGFVCSRR